MDRTQATIPHHVVKCPRGNSCSKQLFLLFTASQKSSSKEHLGYGEDRCLDNLATWVLCQLAFCFCDIIPTCNDLENKGLLGLIDSEVFVQVCHFVPLFYICDEVEHHGRWLVIGKSSYLLRASREREAQSANIPIHERAVLTTIS